MAETAQQGQGSGQSEGATKDEGARAIRKAGEGVELSQAEERSALDFLLGTPKAPVYEVTVQYETDDGLLPLTFEYKALDGRKIDAIEQKHISERTGVMDKGAADAELVFEATLKMRDAAGGETSFADERFRTIKDGEAPLASAIDALWARFGTQVGLIQGVANAIRKSAGWDADRVGKASRRLVEAAGN